MKNCDNTENMTTLNWISLLKICLVLLCSCQPSSAFLPIKLVLPGMILRMNMTIHNTTTQLEPEEIEETKAPLIESRIQMTPAPNQETVLHMEPEHHVEQIKSEWKHVGVFSMEQGYEIDYFHSSSWNKKYRSCSGHRQSPININPTHAKRGNDRIWKYFQDDPKEMMVINNGNTVQLIGNWDKIPVLVGPGILPYRGKHIFSDVTFHWAKFGNGSEHYISGERYALEMQLVFHKKAGNKIVMDAVKKDDHIVILSILYKISATDNPNLADILTGIANIKTAKTMDKITPFPLTKLMPNTSTYFEYSGSLTVPPCTETVTWLVMENHPAISEGQLKSFREVLANNGKPIIVNSRVLQRTHYGGGLV